MIPPGYTFLSRRPGYFILHLHIVISKIISGKVLIVNITTPKTNSDYTCVLKKADHPFIRHDSIVNYADAVDAQIELVKKAIRENTFIPDTPISEELLKRIQEGALKSDAFPPRLLMYIPT
jgi:hypothetical protein